MLLASAAAATLVFVVVSVCRAAASAAAAAARHALCLFFFFLSCTTLSSDCRAAASAAAAAARHAGCVCSSFFFWSCTTLTFPPPTFSFASGRSTQTSRICTALMCISVLNYTRRWRSISNKAIQSEVQLAGTCAYAVATAGAVSSICASGHRWRAILLCSMATPRSSSRRGFLI